MMDVTAIWGVIAGSHFLGTALRQGHIPPDSVTLALEWVTLDGSKFSSYVL